MESWIANERRYVGQPHELADAALAKLPIREETEFDRRDWALDQHVDHPDDVVASLERLERVMKRDRTLGRVEGEYLLRQQRVGQPLRLFWREHGTRCDDEHVVGKFA